LGITELTDFIVYFNSYVVCLNNQLILWICFQWSTY